MVHLALHMTYSKFGTPRYLARNLRNQLRLALSVSLLLGCSSGSTKSKVTTSTGGSASVATCMSGDSCVAASDTCKSASGSVCTCVGPDGARYVACETTQDAGAGGAAGSSSVSLGGTFTMPATGGVSGYGQDVGQPCADGAPYATSGTLDYQINVDASKQGNPWSHFYEKVVAADHANTVLASAYGRNIQNALQKGHDQAGFQYVRFHGILDSDIHVYAEDDAGAPIYDFSRLDQVYDAIMLSGMRPFVEISFTPPALASATNLNAQLLWYDNQPAIISPPKDWTKWANFMTALVQNLEQRYGANEVRDNWYFEVWNEASWMLTTGTSGYEDLYKYTVQGLKVGDSAIRVGGPAESSSGSGPAITNLLSFVSTNGLPIDFVTYHCYASDPASTIADANAINDCHTRLANVAISGGFMGDVFATEWGPDSAASVARDTEVTSSFVAKAIHLLGTNTSVPLPVGYGYWTISDIYEEINTGTNTAYREGNYGLLLKGDPNIPESWDVAKPAFNAFRLLHWLGDVQIEATGGTPANGVNAVATLGTDSRSLQVLVYNHVSGGAADPTQSSLVSLTLNNLPFAAGPVAIRQYFVDHTHSNSHTAWVQMGKPAQPTQDQWTTLRDQSDLCYYDTNPTPTSNSLTLEFPLETYGISLITLQSP